MAQITNIGDGREKKENGNIWADDYVLIVDALRADALLGRQVREAFGKNITVEQLRLKTLMVCEGQADARR